MFYNYTVYDKQDKKRPTTANFDSEASKDVK